MAFFITESHTLDIHPTEASFTNVHNDTHSTDSSPPLEQFDIIFGIWIPGLICISGILGNLIALIVLSRDRDNILFRTLEALACSDMLLLISAMFQQVVPMFCMMNESEEFFCRNQGYIRVYSWPAVCIAQMVSVYLVVLISAERFVAIVLPLSTSFIFNMKTVCYCVASIWLFSIAFNFPKFFEFTPEYRITDKNLTVVELGSTDLRQDPVYRYLYNTALNCVVLYAVPLLVLTVLSFKTVLKIHQSNRRWEQLNRCQQREVKATKMPLVIVMVFFICGSQSLLAFILDAVFVSRTLLWLQYYTAVVNLLVILNSAVNCILMYMFGRKFRALLQDTFTCGRRKWKYYRGGSFRYNSSFRSSTRTISFEHSGSFKKNSPPIML